MLEEIQMNYICLIGIFIVAYLIGSVSSAIIVGRVMTGEDILKKASGNAGATNTLRTLGKKAAAIVTVCDCLKAVVAILIAKLIAYLAGMDGYLSDVAVYTAGIGAVLGHNFPVYFGFKGGKGILVSMVAMLFADWRIGLAVMVVAILIMAVTRYVSLGSVLGAVLLVVLALIFRIGDTPYIVFCVICAALAVFMHRSNIKRLLSGTENKLGLKKTN